MGFPTVRGCIVIALLLELAVPGAANGWQTARDTAYTGTRQRALELFAHGKRLEALPLLEELVQRDPKDSELLVDLAASLLDHAITLTDPQVAGEERLRARDLLDRASKLGNTSPLAMNLSEFLEQLPPTGAIEFSKNPRVEETIHAGEAAFARHDFDLALKNYSQALDLEPGNYSAALFTGNTYDRENKFAPAAEWYERAIEIDPNLETAYRYYADMLAREHDLEGARKMLIQAAVAEPYNRAVWRELHAWAMLSGSEIHTVYVSVPPPAGGPRDGAAGRIRNSPVSSAWEAYRTIRAEWQQGSEFRKRFPQEQTYRHSLPEEANALNGAAAKLAELRANRDTAALVAQDGAAGELLKLYDAALVEPYVLFSLGDAGIAKDYSTYRQNNRRKLEDYMDQFVAPAHAR